MTLSHVERDEEKKGGMRVKIKTMGGGTKNQGGIKVSQVKTCWKREKIESKEEIFKKSWQEFGADVKAKEFRYWAFMNW